MSSGWLRSRSVSSMRSRNSPPVWRAKSQLNRTVRAPPTCRKPVGDGAKRVRAVAGGRVAHGAVMNERQPDDR